MKRLYGLIPALLIFPFGPVSGQDGEWGWMVLIGWENPPPDVYPGYFSPSYSQAESLLYFDTYYRLSGEEGAVIYSSHLDSVDQVDELWWSDPEPLPEPINLEGTRNVMPGINQAGDSLFFCSDREGSRGGLDIWLSVKIDGTWDEPTNLGDSVNSVADEFSPCYSSAMATLFFDRQDDLTTGRIYGSRSLIDGAWSVPTALPEIINIPGNLNYGAYFDDHEMALYYTSADFQWDPDPLVKSRYVDEAWTDPVELEESINGFYRDNPCNLVTTEYAALSDDQDMIIYSKQVWDVAQCFDFYSFLFYSRAQEIDVEEEPFPKSVNLKVNVYPNPSNDQFVFKVSPSTVPWTIRIYDVQGKLVDSFQSEKSSLSWSCENAGGRPVTSGVYFAVFESGNSTAAKKLLLLR